MLKTSSEREAFVRSHPRAEDLPTEGPPTIEELPAVDCQTSLPKLPDTTSEISPERVSLGKTSTSLSSTSVTRDPDKDGYQVQH